MPEQQPAIGRPAPRSYWPGTSRIERREGGTRLWQGRDSKPARQRQAGQRRHPHQLMTRSETDWQRFGPLRRRRHNRHRADWCHARRWQWRDRSCRRYFVVSRIGTVKAAHQGLRPFLRDSRRMQGYRRRGGIALGQVDRSGIGRRTAHVEQDNTSRNPNPQDRAKRYQRPAPPSLRRSHHATLSAARWAGWSECVVLSQTVAVPASKRA